MPVFLWAAVTLPLIFHANATDSILSQTQIVCVCQNNVAEIKYKKLWEQTCDGVRTKDTRRMLEQHFSRFCSFRAEGLRSLQNRYI